MLELLECSVNSALQKKIMEAKRLELNTSCCKMTKILLVRRDCTYCQHLVTCFAYRKSNSINSFWYRNDLVAFTVAFTSGWLLTGHISSWQNAQRADQLVILKLRFCNCDLWSRSEESGVETLKWLRHDACKDFLYIVPIGLLDPDLLNPTKRWI